MSTTLQTQRGLITITELFITAVILTLLAGVLLVMGSAGQQVLMTSDAKLDSQSDAQRVINRISEDLRNTTITSLATAGHCAPAAVSPTPMFILDPIDPDGPLGPLAAPAQVRYVFTPPAGQNTTGRLERTQGGVTTVVSSRITAFTPTCTPATGMVRLQVTAQVRTPRGRPLTQSLDTNIWVEVP